MDDKDLHPAEADKKLTRPLASDILAALNEEDTASLQQYMADLPPQDIAELFNQFNSSHRQMLAEQIGDLLDAEVFSHLEPDAAEDVMQTLGAEKSGKAIADMERDDALHLLEDLDEAEQQDILQAVDPETRLELQQGLAYPESSAGRLMRPSMVSIPEFWNVGNTIDYLRTNPLLPDDFYVIFATDPKFHPVGAVPLSRIMQTKRDVPIKDIMATELHTQHVLTDQEEVAFTFRKYGLVEAPVVNDQGRLVGTVTVDDIVDVIQEEEEENILRAGGVRSQDIYDPIIDTAKQRFLWLFINLLTAIGASLVVNAFRGAIEKVVLLAVLMPIVASMGGNAGIQSSTVMVRALANRRISTRQALFTVLKEVTVGALNGIGNGLICAAGIYIIWQDAALAGVFMVAMIVNLMVAGMAGCALPVVLTRLKIDPAITSGVFLTTFTDIAGFFTFLGLAAWILG